MRPLPMGAMKVYIAALLTVDSCNSHAGENVNKYNAFERIIEYITSTNTQAYRWKPAVMVFIQSTTDFFKVKMYF